MSRQATVGAFGATSRSLSSGQDLLLRQVLDWRLRAAVHISDGGRLASRLCRPQRNEPSWI